MELKESIPISTANAPIHFATIGTLERGKYSPAVGRAGYKDSLWPCMCSMDSDKSTAKQKKSWTVESGLCDEGVWGGGTA